MAINHVIVVMKMNEIMNKYPVLKDGYQLYQGANIVIFVV
jgi:hypothetical protein